MSRVSWKLSRAVLRGAVGGNVDRLLDKKIDPKTKQPFAYTLSNGQPFAFAGLWDAWKDPATGEWFQTFAIITTTPNELTAQVHDRMPVICIRATMIAGCSAERAHELLRPYDADEMTVSACNPAAGNVRNNGPEMLACPDPESAAQLNSK